MNPDVAKLLAKARELGREYKEGTNRSPGAFRELMQLVLGLTVLDERESLFLYQEPPHFIVSGRDRKALSLVGRRRYLRVYFRLWLEPHEAGQRLKVREAGFAFQATRDNKRWVFRYEYIRSPSNRYAGSHLHVRGALDESGCLPRRKPLGKVHFPTSRISLEAVIRLLIEDFNVRARTPSEVWRQVLTETEKEFLDIAHKDKDVSGPQE